MAWPVRSQVLWALSRTTTVANTRYSSGVVPPGEIWLIKDVSLFNNHSASRVAFLTILHGGVEYFSGSTTLAAFGVLHDAGLSTVLAPGDQYQVYWTAGTTGFTIYVSGAKL